MAVFNKQNPSAKLLLVSALQNPGGAISLEDFMCLDPDILL